MKKIKDDELVKEMVVLTSSASSFCVSAVQVLRETYIGKLLKRVFFTCIYPGQGLQILARQNITHSRWVLTLLIRYGCQFCCCEFWLIFENWLMFMYIVLNINEYKKEYGHFYVVLQIHINKIMRQWLFPGQTEHSILSSNTSVNIDSLSMSRQIIKSNKVTSLVIVHKVHLWQPSAHTGVLRAHRRCWVWCFPAATPQNTVSISQCGKSSKAGRDSKTKVTPGPVSMG